MHPASEDEPPKPRSVPGPAPDPDVVAEVGRRVSLACSFCHAKTSRGETVFCASCLAPHHADCFRTHGRCSLPGCGEEQTVRPGDRSTRRSSTRWSAGLVLAAVASGAATLLLAPWPRAAEPPMTDEALEVAEALQVAASAEAAKPAEDAVEAPGAPATLFGKPLDSRAFVIALDVSSSMRVIDMPPDELWTDEEGKSHRWRDPGLGPPEEGSRFRRVKREVARLISTLRADTSFGLVVFGTRARSWRPWLVAATRSNRKAAALYVEGLPWEAGTATGEGLDLAFGLRADTVLLITDGVPERTLADGTREEIPHGELVERSRALNPGGSVRMHCFGFFGGSDGVHRFLHDLAAAHEGEYRDIPP